MSLALRAHRYRAILVALVLTTAAIWLWNWTEKWHLYSNISLEVLSDADPPVKTAPPKLIGDHGSVNAVTPEENANATGAAAIFQLQLSEWAERLFPASSTESWMVHNRNALRDLMVCNEGSICGTNQEKIVIFSAYEFRTACDGKTGGEEIWAAAVTLASKNLGYTYFYVPNLAAALPLYSALPSHVRAIFANDYDLEMPGIPLHKIFSISFWAQPAHPFGAQWTLSPEDYKSIGMGENTYLGYSIEATCAQHPFVPHVNRSANEAYILAKLLSLFLPERDRAWSPEVMNAATQATGITYVGGSYVDTETRDGPAPQAPEPMWATPELPEQYTNEGMKPQFKFLERLSEMRVLIGMGNPATSPTPYDALCLGVPFINPISSWDTENPTDRSRWASQHPPLARLDPPYVYNVFQDDVEGFVGAIISAIKNPIPSFVLDDMKIKSVETRLDAILNKDWEGEATRLGLIAKRHKRRLPLNAH